MGDQIVLRNQGGAPIAYGFDASDALLRGFLFPQRAPRKRLS
jgi:hypothetical protein